MWKPMRIRFRQNSGECCCPRDLEEETWVVADAMRADHGNPVEEHQVDLAMFCQQQLMFVYPPVSIFLSSS